MEYTGGGTSVELMVDAKVGKESTGWGGKVGSMVASLLEWQIRCAILCRLISGAELSSSFIVWPAGVLLLANVWRQI